MLFKIFLVLSFMLSTVFSQICNQCQGCCSTSEFSSALCKCDNYCREFGDCCGENSHPNLSTSSPLSHLSDGVRVQCQSILTKSDTQAFAENEAFLMVSSCPDDWFNPENTFVSYNCSSLTQTLPPVTDITTGLVYKNEYCAQCNRVQELVAWSSQLICNQSFNNFITDSANASSLSATDLQKHCFSYSHIPPNITDPNILSPRSCIPRTETCLPHLYENEFNKTKNELDLRQCQSGPLDLVISVDNGKVYRNKFCAACNAENATECFELKEKKNEDCDGTRKKIPIMTTESVPPVTTTEAELNFTGWTEFDIISFLLNLSVPPLPSYSPTINCGQNLPFTITLRNLGGGQIDLSSNRGIRSIIKLCKTDEVLLETKCRPTFCPEGYSVDGGRCSSSQYAETDLSHISLKKSTCNFIVSVNNGSYVDLGNNTILLTDGDNEVKVKEYDDFGNPIICVQNNSARISYLNCTSALVALDKSEYTIINNRSILVEGKVVEVNYYDNGRPLICPDHFNSSTAYGLLPSLPGLQELTYIGCSLSVVGGIAVLTTYSIFSELQTVPGLILMNLCITITGTSLVFLIGGPLLQYYPLKAICTTAAIALHYSYLSQFSWMSIFSLQMTIALYKARKLIPNTRKRKWKCFAVYLTVGWVIPLIVISITVIVNFTTDGLVLYGVNDEGDEAACWINHYKTFIITFILPVVLSLTCNLILFVITTGFLCRAYKDQSKVDKSNIVTMMRVWVATFTITGLTWLFGFISNLRDISWVWYFFVVFNSTQGFSIFLTFIFTKKVFNFYMSLIKSKIKSGMFPFRAMQKKVDTDVQHV